MTVWNKNPFLKHLEIWPCSVYFLPRRIDGKTILIFVAVVLIFWWCSTREYSSLVHTCALEVVFGTLSWIWFIYYWVFCCSIHTCKLKVIFGTLLWTRFIYYTLFCYIASIWGKYWNWDFMKAFIALLSLQILINDTILARVLCFWLDFW